MLNESIYGHHVLRHPDQDYAQFVESLGLTGNKYIDDILWYQHEQAHDL
jgi:hypothetical protein